jgi:hypothetical protein
MSSDSKYGDKTEYDKKCFTLYKTQNKTKTIESIRVEINSLTKLVNECGEIMEKYCVSGYSWTNSINNTIKYYEDMILDIDNLMN